MRQTPESYYSARAQVHTQEPVYVQRAEAAPAAYYPPPVIDFNALAIIGLIGLFGFLAFLVFMKK